MTPLHSIGMMNTPFAARQKMPQELKLIKQALAEFKKHKNTACQIGRSASGLQAELKEVLDLFDATKNDQVIFDYIDGADRRDYMICETP